MINFANIKIPINELVNSDGTRIGADNVKLSVDNSKSASNSTLDPMFDANGNQLKNSSIQSTRQQGLSINSEEITPNVLKKRELDVDLAVINIAGLNQKTISELDRYVEQNFLRVLEAKKRSLQSRVIIYDSTEVRVPRKGGIELKPPPIIQALLDGKFFEALQAGFLRIEPLPEKLFQAILEVLKGREKEKNIN